MTDRALQVYRLVKNADGEIDAVPLEQIPDFKSLLNPVGK